MNEVAPLDVPLAELFSQGGELQSFARLDVIFTGKKKAALLNQPDPNYSQQIAGDLAANPAAPGYLLPRSAKGYTTEPSIVELARMYDFW